MMYVILDLSKILTRILRQRLRVGGNEQGVKRLQQADSDPSVSLRLHVWVKWRQVYEVAVVSFLHRLQHIQAIVVACKMQ